MNTPPAPDDADGSDQPSPPSDTPPPQGMDYIPMPPIIKLFFVGVAAVLVFALIRLPGTLNIPIQYELGERAIAKGDSDSAVAHLEPVAKAYPTSNDVQIELASAYFLNNQFRESAQILDSFNDKPVTPAQEQKLTALAKQLDWVIQQLQEAEAKEKSEKK